MNAAEAMAASGTPEQLPHGICEAEGTELDWWCWKTAKFVGSVGNEHYYACPSCPAIFRLGAA